MSAPLPAPVPYLAAWTHAPLLGPCGVKSRSETDPFGKMVRELPTKPASHSVRRQERVRPDPIGSLCTGFGSFVTRTNPSLTPSPRGCSQQAILERLPGRPRQKKKSGSWCSGYRGDGLAGLVCPLQAFKYYPRSVTWAPASACNPRSLTCKSARAFRTRFFPENQKNDPFGGPQTYQARRVPRSLPRQDNPLTDPYERLSKDFVLVLRINFSVPTFFEPTEGF